MGFIFRIIATLLKIIIYLAIFFAAIILLPNLPPYTNFTSIELEPTQPRVGPLAPNEALNNPEKLYAGKLLGPETFQVFNGEVYTGLATGEIVKISGGHVTFVAKIGQPCIGVIQEHICGRPLGFTIDEKNKILYVADAYLGIWKVDLKTNKKQLLVSPQVEIDGQKPKLFNGIILNKDGDLYWTDSSSDFYLKDGVFTMLSDPSGRLFYYNAAKNKSEVLLDNLWFPNGIAISPDNQFLVVTETLHYRLLKYYISGPKKGKSEVFVDGLPGTPDNIRSLPDGSGTVVGLYLVFDDENPLLGKSMANTPLVRKFLARLLRLLEVPFEFLHSLFPNVVFEDILYNIGHFKSLASMAPRMSGLVVIDWNGNIIASYYNTDGSLTHISDAVVYNDKLYLGNPHVQNFIAAVPAPPLLKQAFASTKTSPPPKAKVEQKVQAKPVETSKPSVQEKKMEQKKEAPKTVKPVQEAPKPAQNTKPVETVKATTPKPTQPPKQAENKPPTPKQSETKPSTPPKQPETKPSTPSKQPETKPNTPRQRETKPAAPKQPETKPASPKQPETKPASPKQPEVKPASPNQPEVKPASPKQPEIKPATPPKQPETKPTPTKPNVQEKPTAKPVNTEQKPQNVNRDAPKPANNKPASKPIKEDIPSDTVKPNKETLKVIKKDGPTEIPNPNP